MQKLFSAFPDGLPGLGLVILRLAIALNGLIQGYNRITAPSSTSLAAYALTLGCLAVSVAFLIGLLTPLAAILATCGYLVRGILLLLESGGLRHAASCPALDLAVMSLTLVLLGPGAYSLDARLFARREIIIHDVRRPGM